MAVQGRNSLWYNTFMEVMFWIFFGIIGYIFFGYPTLVFLVSKFVKRLVRKKPNTQDQLPTVTLIIAAYNEAMVIKKKIENTLAIDYPKDKLQVIVFSDGSTDHTDAIVKSYSSVGIELMRIEGRVGKTECQNQVIVQATGEIVVFSDANSMYDWQAIKNLVRNFSDDKIGCVVGELRYRKNEKSDEGLYWKLEQFLKKKESVIDSCLGANGAIYAVRKDLYIPLPSDAISDFIEPFKIYAQGFRVVYEPSAFCTETVLENKTEFLRKRRIITRTMRSLPHISEFLNPFRYGWYSISLWSHKILRWFPAVFLIVLFIANTFLLDQPFFQITFILQISFYVFAFIGIFYHKKIFSIPYLFIVMHIAALYAIGDIFIGKKTTTWKPLRTNE